jgi:hypothetical protein
MKSIALTPGRRLGTTGRQVSAAGLWSGGHFHRMAVPNNSTINAGRLNCRVRISRPSSPACGHAEN